MLRVPADPFERVVDALDMGSHWVTGRELRHAPPIRTNTRDDVVRSCRLEERCARNRNLARESTEAGAGALE